MGGTNVMLDNTLCRYVALGISTAIVSEEIMTGLFLSNTITHAIVHGRQAQTALWLPLFQSL